MHATGESSGVIATGLRKRDPVRLRLVTKGRDGRFCQALPSKGYMRNGFRDGTKPRDAAADLVEDEAEAPPVGALHGK